MSKIIGVCNKYKDAFEKKHGVKLGFMSIFVAAAAQALREVPAVNACKCFRGRSFLRQAFTLFCRIGACIIYFLAYCAYLVFHNLAAIDNATDEIVYHDLHCCFHT